MKPFFSIVIPAFNCRQTLTLLLRCLEAQTLSRERFECLIVDDCSKDGTSAFLNGYQTGINLSCFSHPINLGRSQARNTACAQAKGDILVFVDADMLPEPDWLANYDMAFMQRPLLDVISGGRYRIHLGSTPENRPLMLGQMLGVSPHELFSTQVTQQFECISKNAHQGMYPGYAMAKIEMQLPDVCQQYPESLLCAYSVITSNVAVRREIFEKVGGFDISIRLPEDTDLGVRLWEIGAHFGCAPNARAYHMYHTGDRNNTLVERQAFFHRHPHQVILLLNLWFAYHDQPDPAIPSAIFDSLLTMAAAEQELPDIDVNQEFHRVYRQRSWADCICDRDFMVEYYREHTGISQQEIDAYLDQAIVQGLVMHRRDGRFYFDLDHTTNWLLRSTTYQQYELEHSRYSWIRNQIPYTKTNPSSASTENDLDQEIRNISLKRAPLLFKCRSIYEVSIPKEALPEATLEATLNIPIPIEHTCQTDIRIAHCFPETLLDYVNAERTMISGFPLQLGLCEDGGITIHYAFECNLREYLLAENEDEIASMIGGSQYLKPTYPSSQLNKMEAILKKIFARPAGDSYAIAQTIYIWILNNKRYLRSFFADYQILDTGFGPCFHLSRLFINLCRLMRVPAREQCGAMLGRPLAPNKPQHTVVTERAVSALAHTWAEFYTPLQGWVPVEFSATSFGKHVLTATNVKSKALRDQMDRETNLYSNYYFGNMDPFRIYTSEQASQVPTYPLVKSKMAPDALKMLVLQTRHRLVCDVSGTAEFSDLHASLQTIRETLRPSVSIGLTKNATKNFDIKKELLHTEALPTFSNQVASGKRMLITSIGSTGDVQPLLGLAEELNRHGHQITFALPSNYRDRIQKLGFRFVEIGAGTGVDAWHEIFARQAEIADPAQQARYFVEALAPWIPQMFRELSHWCVATEADMLISPAFHLAARMVHDAIKIPFVSVHFSPFGSKGGKALREGSAPLINQYRQQAGLPSLHDPLGADNASPQLALYAASHHVFRPPAEWPAHYHLTGYWYFDERDWQPDAALLKFIQAGEPPVVVSFGSMPSEDPTVLTDLIVTAIKQAGCRAVIQHGGGGLAQGRVLPENIHAVDFVPHSWLFPRAACVVHHGGAGTTAAAFRAGVPTVVVPHLLDQPIWAEYARAFGCAGAVIPNASLTAGQLSAAITQTLSQPRYRRSAARLGEQIRTENGAQTARQLIEQMLSISSHDRVRQ